MTVREMVEKAKDGDANTSKMIKMIKSGSVKNTNPKIQKVFEAIKRLA